MNTLLYQLFNELRLLSYFFFFFKIYQYGNSNFINLHNNHSTIFVKNIINFNKICYFLDEISRTNVQAQTSIYNNNYFKTVNLSYENGFRNLNQLTPLIMYVCEITAVESKIIFL